jgi:cullin 2
MEHIKQQGLRTVTNLSGDNIAVQFVEGMLSVHSKYKEITNTVFSNDQLFSSALDMACAAVVNHRFNTKQNCRSPELLAKYCDTLLKKSTKGGSDTEVDDKLTQCITVFKYIDDKDVYQAFYSRKLAHRLISQLSQSMDAEEAMINRLKQACGYEFTNKLHRMFTDMSVSSDLNNKFNQLNKDRMIELGLNFSIYVLQTGAWPRQVCPTDFAVPQELEKSVQEFEDFYRLQFNGRKLAWLHHLSYGELKLNYLKKRYFITMGTFQMAMLLVFQETNSVTCGELMEATKLNSDQFQKVLQSLVDSKLLAVTSDTVEVFQPSTVISLNMDYSNKRTKFRINNTIQKETVQETETTHSCVNEDRKMYLQVRIIRIF